MKLKKQKNCTRVQKQRNILLCHVRLQTTVTNVHPRAHEISPSGNSETNRWAKRVRWSFVTATSPFVYFPQKLKKRRTPTNSFLLSSPLHSLLPLTSISFFSEAFFRCNQSDTTIWGDDQSRHGSRLLGLGMPFSLWQEKWRCRSSSLFVFPFQIWAGNVCFHNSRSKLHRIEVSSRWGFVI